jgi:phosphatidylglycerol:prolipoprotein diacylglycerol transferase
MGPWFEFDGLHFLLFGEEQIIHFYGFIIMAGAVLAAWLASREVKRRGQDPELVWDLLIWLLIAGIVGARLWHVFFPTKDSGLTTMYYFTHPLDLLNTRRGGLGIPGAVIGGAIALFFYARKHKLNFLEWIDIAAPAVALGQAVGRWGNYFNQELYGAPTNLPWKIFIDPEHRLRGFEQYEYFHPLFLYESLWNLGNMFLLIWLSRRHSGWLKPGDIFLVYLIVYPAGRFLLDFLRLDIAVVGSVNINQMIMGGTALVAAAVLAARHWKRSPTDNSVNS